MTVIGITGPTGAGKTTALNELVKLGGRIYDADAVYHELLKSNSALRNELENRFGSLTDETGEFQRKKLGAIVFNDKNALNDLNTITHGAVKAKVQRQLSPAPKLSSKTGRHIVPSFSSNPLAKACTSSSVAVPSCRA